MWTQTRKSFAVIAMACVALVVTTCHDVAVAQNTTLYGITYDGKLLQIDVSNVTATQVRTTLPSIGGVYSGLALYNNTFQTFADYTSTSTFHDIISFGPTTGDQVNRGAIRGESYRATALATSPDGDLKTMEPVIYLSKKAIALSSISLNFNRADPLPNPVFYTLISAPLYTGDNIPITGLAFTDNSTAYEINEYQVYPGYQGRLRKLAKVNGMWTKANEWLPTGLPRNGFGLVVDPNSATTLYTVGGYDFSGSPPLSATLYSINIAGSPTVSNLGTFSGYSITGLVYGPALNQVSSPGSLPNPPPSRPRRMGDAAFEVIRQIIFN